MTLKRWIRTEFAPALAQLDLRIHREIFRLRASYQLSLDEFRGLYISDAQVDALVNQRFQQRQDRESAEKASGVLDIELINQRIESLRPLVQSSLAKHEAWTRLCTIYCLTEVERDIVFMALAPELDPKYETLFAYLNNDVTRKYPSVSLIMRLAGEGEENQYRQALGATSKLCANGMINLSSTASGYHLNSGFFPSAVLTQFLTTESAAPDPLYLKLPRSSLQPWQTLPFPEAILQPLSNCADKARRGEEVKLLVKSAKNAASEELVCSVFSSAGVPCYVLDLLALLDSKEQLRQRLSQLCLYLNLHRAALIVDFYASPGLAQDVQFDLSHIVIDTLINKVPLLGFVCGQNDWRNALFSSYPLYSLCLPAPTITQRERLWQQKLGEKNLHYEMEDLNAVAEFFNLEYKQISSAADQLVLLADDKKLVHQQLFDVAMAQSYSEIADLAAKVKNKFVFKDLILPAEILGRVKEVIAATRNRQLVFDEWGFAARTGNVRGIVALFAGASGTGKTMSASVIANEIGLDLYRVDLSRVVSKYIGETEKNLDKIFNAARQANCILFIDEADALLGKRSEVKDAHDRNANVEVAFLLQKMEEHDGVVILTTNLAKNIDQAFTRRLQFVIDFPRPDEQHRELIWRNMFGSKAPLHSDVDFGFLARQFNNTGGDIKNIALDAALLAAESERKQIDMPLLIRACARQMVKQGKVPSANEFKHFFALVGTH